MHGRPLLILIPIVLVLLAADWFFARGANSLGIASAKPLSGSGLIQADESTVANEVAGRVIELNVDEGDSVHADQPLAKLDVTLLAASRASRSRALRCTCESRESASRRAS
jgi:multidrug efflux pump subunit AcrA (membrane-fusion protein)